MVFSAAALTACRRCTAYGLSCFDSQRFVSHIFRTVCAAGCCIKGHVKLLCCFVTNVPGNLDHRIDLVLWYTCMTQSF